MNTDLFTYYKERAQEYERVYQKPERQEELRQATAILQDIFSGRHVFEVACGTGYWTERIAATANFILATDINEAVLEVAKTKTYPKDSVSFRQADLFDLASLAAKYESLFGGFIWSHIRLQDLPHFIGILNNRVVPGGTVVLMDNHYVEGSSLPISQQDVNGNTYQTRTLENGSQHLVLKNFPTEAGIRELLQDKATDINFTNLQHYWILSYKTLPQEV
ncbi:class I SAM-dependent methyltransferase [Pontibacter ruber]|uniref:Class I SAM-dependent methyltransferase n=1 Tax=Pontibacter ruber TaxID=1343895 RepID=A0ABW5CY44_9BACT|nr:class I SAM-dependent methyltransferase [Pontibacter ruber]